LSAFELEPSHQDNLNDIQLVVESRFRKTWNILDTENLSDEVADCVSNLVVKSEGLFIYVRAVCEFLERSDLLLPKEQMDGFKSGPDEVYALIAKKASEVIGAKIFQSVLGCILFANEPLDVPSTRSILKISDGRVSIIHKSIKDYFSTVQRSNQYFIHLETANTQMGAGCLVAVSSILVTLSSRPVRDLVDLLANKASGITITNLLVEGSKSLATYTLGNWANHLEKASNDVPIEFSSTSRHCYDLCCGLEQGKGYFTSPPLYEAAKRGLASVCTALLDSKLGDVTPETGGSNNTPLIVATTAKSLESVKVLSLLQKVVWKRDLQAVKNELKTGSDFLIPNPADGSTELHYAAEFFDETIFMLMWTPLHIAAENGHVDAARLLLENGAEPKAEDDMKEGTSVTAGEEAVANLFTLQEQLARVEELESVAKETVDQASSPAVEPKVDVIPLVEVQRHHEKKDAVGSGGGGCCIIS
ncbi:UNVERIFIED_CONTAM: hypothetical protein HDU68_003179, partial [Siphonaria sp. JEL0065]